MFDNIYQNKKVVITGHTGFKGTWLSTWLLGLGAKVIGVSKDVPSNPAMFEVLELEPKIKHYTQDIRNLKAIQAILNDEQPDFIFHLAAQAIVSTSYQNPIETISSNVLGTSNILEALRLANYPCVAVIITSDKAYDNVEQVWGYQEDDALGGKDIYSGSKGAADLIIKSYYHSFFKNKDCHIKLGVARAGNVIGGGDFAKDRIVVDCMAAWHQGNPVEIRAPNATRPWQHVLEPLSGYLALGQRLYQDKVLHGEAFNFGPRAEQNHTVLELLQDLSKQWQFESTDKAFVVSDNIPFHEAGLLKLNCDKALFYLKWQAVLAYQQTVELTGDWYYCFYHNKADMLEMTNKQIEQYQALAQTNQLPWTR